MKYIITYFPEFRKAAIGEAEKAGGINKRSLTPNMSVVEFPENIKQLLESNTIFIRHIMPVMVNGMVSKDNDKALPHILDSVKAIASIGKDEGFSVQCRIVESEAEYSSKDVEVFVGKHYDDMGCIPVFSDYGLTGGEETQIISVLIYGSELFCGFSSSDENLNFHSDEYRILSRGQGREISRAENKLKEAIHKFHIKIKGSGFALDVGASPGGWSKVLADYGFNVFAVDPGDLHPSLKENERIKHFKSKIEDLSFNEKFEVVVNDMNIDPQQTADIMNKLSHNLETDAYAVVTLKLPFSDINRSIGEALEILKTNYELLALKNLTHNRREVTALLRRI